MTQLSQIVVFGSGPVAARSIELIAPHFNIKLVVTKRNRARSPAPVETLAKNLGLEIEFADTKNEVSDLISQNKIPATPCGLVIDYGVILANDAICHFPLGIVNSHFSLLPELRGADPISFAILEGKEQTGVSLMKIVDKLDEGDLISIETLRIAEDDTTPLLTEKLVRLSAEMLIKELPRYIRGEIVPYPQKGSASYTRKLTKADGHIDPNKTVNQLMREVRAYSGWPKSYTKLGDIDVVITSAIAVLADPVQPGTVVASNDKKYLDLCCSDGYLRIVSLTPAGKKEMSAQAFINGYGDKLGL